ncbi:MAG: Panacea domain-containing protein [Lacipirellulaceae bacterium]
MDSAPTFRGFDAGAVANEFLARAKSDGRELTPMQVLKLVYIAHGYCLAMAGRPLIADPVEAWKFGPVIPSLYHDVKLWGNDAIDQNLTRAVRVGDRFEFAPRSLDDCDTDASFRSFVDKLLDQVWTGYGRFSGAQLSALTHKPGTPWHDAWENQGGKNERGFRIKPIDIQRHYRERLDLALAQPS